MINLVNFDLVNSDFSFNFLKFTHIDHTLSYPKQKFIFKILNLIRLSDFFPFLRITGDHFLKFALRTLHCHRDGHSGTSKSIFENFLCRTGGGGGGGGGVSLVVQRKC